jgi:hypothetical protein
LAAKIKENYVRCGDCKFWKDHPASPERLYGWCKRFPPQRYLEVYPGDAESLIKFGNKQGCPEILQDDWCGEFQPRLEQ